MQIELCNLNNVHLQKITHHPQFPFRLSVVSLPCQSPINTSGLEPLGICHIPRMLSVLPAKRIPFPCLGFPSPAVIRFFLITEYLFSSPDSNIFFK